MAEIERRILGSTGMEVTVLGFGGAEIGYESATQETTTRLLNEALDNGLNVIDTAECYMASEEMIGQAASHRRGEYYLFTKCGHEEHGKGDWSSESLLRTIERSLKRLRTDVVDLVQLHSCDEDILRTGEAIDALDEARDRGYTKFIGYSGDGAAARYAVECGRFDTLQTSVNIADQESIDLTLPLAKEAGLGVIAKRPVANAAWRHGATPPEEQYHLTYWERVRELDYPWFSLPLGEAIAIALRFTLSQPGVSTAIVGTKQPGRWLENARALAAGPLAAAEMEAIRNRYKQVANDSWTGQI